MSEQLLIYTWGGEAHCAPSDTMPAYWSAVGAGAEGIVLGVQLSSDGVAICCSQADLETTTGEANPVSGLTAGKIAKLDAGKRFRSTVLGKDNQPKGNGDDTPWDGERQRPLYHPTFHEFLLYFARRTQLIVMPIPKSNSKAAINSVVEVVVEELGKFGLENKTMLSGGKAIVEAVASHSPVTPTAYRAEEGESANDAQKNAVALGCVIALCDAESWGGETDAEPAIIATSREMEFALSPKTFKTISKSSALVGITARAIHETRSLMREPQPTVADDFAGKRINRMNWTCGYSKVNQDTMIYQDDGLHVEIMEGGEYSGAAALTTYPIIGSFDAQLDFQVENPHQGTTFELAAIQVDPGYHHMANNDLSRKSTNLTFDVHGAPPYASSERDENDGFRIGWNNGPAVTQFVDRHPQSSNIYNKYSRDVGDGGTDNLKGSLRLVRSGSVFSAYYMDKHNKAWVMCGAANVPTLCDEVFLRIGVKHWPKRGITPPRNALHFQNFRLYLI
ncbi:MAG: hypothetical protein GY742_20165 [Hyphomicrobiales bacterium]|nr:hypothetical protein [Hyphomicrobiales bacterium]